MKRSHSTLLLVITYIAFVSLGFPDAITGVAWPSVRETFSLPQSGLGLILISSSTGYFLSGIVAGRVLQAIGVGWLLTASSLMVTTGLLGYTLTPAWWLFLACAFLIGLGSGAVDTGLNAYAAEHFSARHMQFMHGFFGVGAMIGPLIMTGVLAGERSWRLGYAVVASVIFVMGVVFFFFRHKWQDRRPRSVDDRERQRTSPLVALRHPIVWLQIAIFVLYTGMEFTVGQWTYTVLREGRGASDEVAGLIVSGYWGALALGRIVLGSFADRIGPERLLRLGVIGALAGAVLFAIGGASLSAAGILLTGFSLAPIFPTLMTVTPRRVGTGIAVHAIGFQVSAAVVGGSAIPALIGLLAGEFGLTVVGWCAVAVAGALWLLHESVSVAVNRHAAASHARVSVAEEVR